MNKTQDQRMLGANEEYYKYIFKKTEKIVCAVFYIVRNNTNYNGQDILIKDAEETARRLADQAITTLTVSEGEGIDQVRTIGAGLVALETKLRMLRAAGLLSQDILHVFVNEIDAVNRLLRKYSVDTNSNPLFDSLDTTPAAESVPSRSTQTPAVRTNASSSAAPSTPSQTIQTPDRTTRVLAVLQEKGQASIKDVSEVIKDCSEKTIQRELNALIKDGIIVRKGERRWSTYSII